MDVKKPVVSVVITTKNEERNIEACIKSILAQTFPRENIEIIVVDNSSTDRTQQIAKKYTPGVFTKGTERSMQRNYGAQKANGTYYMYLDADMTLHPRVIEEAVQTMEQHADILGLYIPEIVTGESYWSRVRRFERSFYNATVIDCVRFVRLSVFNEIKGFDESMTGPEDWDFDKKIRQKGKTALLNSPIYHNEAEFDLMKYLSKKSYYAESFATYIAKWGKDDPDIQKQFGLWYRYAGVFIEQGRWKKLIRNPHLVVGMYTLRGIVGITYILSKLK